MKVLIVETDKLVSENLQALLKKRGLEVQTCSDGLQAIQIQKKFHPGLLIIAQKLPRFTGLETVDLYRKSAGGEPTPVLLLLSETSPTIAKQTSHVKNLGVMTKPLRLTDFWERLEVMFPSIATGGYSCDAIRKLLKTAPLQKLWKDAAIQLTSRLGTAEECAAFSLQIQNRQFYVLIPPTSTPEELLELSDRALELQVRLLEMKNGKELVQQWPVLPKAA